MIFRWLRRRKQPIALRPRTLFMIGADVWPGLSKWVEENGETLQVIGKLMGTAGNSRHWDGSDMVERVEEEMADQIAAISYVLDHNPVVSRRTVFERAWDKREMFERWHDEERR